MGEGDPVTELAEVSANNNVAAEDKSEAFTEKKNAEMDEIKEVEEESKKADEKDSENMDIDKKEVKESKADEENNADQDHKGTEEKPETKFEVMEKETAEKPNKDKGVQKEEKESPKEHEVEKGSKESGKSDSGALKKYQKRKRKVEDKKEPEPITPLVLKVERPVRQRKTVERLVASIEGGLTKEIQIEKGSGTALKDIPNVAYKLSKRETDDTVKLLHSILFGRRGKAAQFKSNISQFSGFVWHENEEKQKMKIKEKLDKCAKEDLLELCDVLDIPVANTTSRKEHLELQLMDFLVSPHPTTSELLAEKDQSSKGKKRERASKKSPSSAEGSTKSHKTEGVSSKTEKKKKKNVDEPKDDQEDGPGVVKVNGVQERTDDEISDQAESEEEDSESEEEYKKEKKKRKRSSNKSSDKTKKTQTKKTPNSSKGSNKNDNKDANSKVYSKKKTTEVAKGKSSTGNKVMTGKGKKKSEKLWPSDDELRSAICEVLKEVDFNTATFTDIVQILAKRYDTDLTPRKTSVKNMIQDELTKLADEADEEDEEENTEDDEKQPSVGSGEA